MMRRPTGTLLKPREYGYVSGYKDRHTTTRAEHLRCMSTSKGCLEWLAGWREGQADRRRDDPDTMLYMPLWPTEATALKEGRNQP